MIDNFCKRAYKNIDGGEDDFRKIKKDKLK